MASRLSPPTRPLKKSPAPPLSPAVRQRLRAPQATAAPLVPSSGSLAETRRAAAACRACDLWRIATQTVFGEGVKEAELMLIGEQPGDKEDRAGRPFVGPAGQLLDAALADAGIDRKKAYVTNAVKHFKSEERGKRRIHKSPNRAEVAACLPWLEAEIDIIKPKLLVALGATAAKALLGPDFRVTRSRGQVLDSPLGPPILATVHPSSILRAPDDEARHAERAAFVADLKKAARFLARG
jgi:DNA polymerase